MDPVVDIKLANAYSHSIPNSSHENLPMVGNCWVFFLLDHRIYNGDCLEMTGVHRKTTLY